MQDVWKFLNLPVKESTVEGNHILYSKIPNPKTFSAHKMFSLLKRCSISCKILKEIVENFLNTIVNAGLMGT